MILMQIIKGDERGMICKRTGNRYLAIGLVWLIIISVLWTGGGPQTAFAAGEFAGGDGSAGNPYQITKLEQLNNMRNYLDKHFILMNNLDFSLDTDYEDSANKTAWTTGTGWTPIGTTASPFTGVLDGDGHTISGLMISPYRQGTPYTIGLFASINSGAEIKNIALKDVNIPVKAGCSVKAGGLACECGGSVTNCSVSGTVAGSGYVGGLVGTCTGTISNSYSTATVIGYNLKGSPYKKGITGGGLVGILSGASAEITGSYFSGTISLFSFEGGLVGKADGSTLSNCYSTGYLTGVVTDGGGLVGDADKATVRNCYALGSIEPYTYPVGGYQGGLIGNVIGTTSIEYCYSAGSVTGKNPSGLIGRLGGTGNTLTSCYYNSETSGRSDTDKGTPKTPAEMRTAGTFTDWDFGTAWDIVNTETNCSYPYLRGNAQSPAPGYAAKVPVTAEPQDTIVKRGENTGFNVAATGVGLTYQWQVDTGSGFNNIADGGVYSGATTAALGITGAAAGMNGYKYRVIVSGTEAYTATSDSASLTVKLPNAPVISVAAGDSHTVVSWNPVAEATGYYVYSSNASGSYGTALATVSGSVYSYDAAGLANGAIYYFTVQATGEGIESDYSNEVSAIPQVAAPGVPVLQSAAAGDRQVNLSWSGVAGSNGYKIFYSTTSGTYGEPAATVSESVYSYSVMGLVNGTPYYFVVSAENPGGDSGYSIEISATPVSVPGAPANIIALAGNGQATVSFTAPEDNGGSPVTGYIVIANPGGKTATEVGSPITVTGLANGMSYTFTVQAVNAAGTGEKSAASSAVIPRGSSGSDGTANENAFASSAEPIKPSESGVEILVNGSPETAAVSATITTGDKTVTTVTVDDQKVEEKLQMEGNKAVVTIPVQNNADVVIGQLTGQTVKNMENKEAVLEIKTGNITYTLPAAQINIDNVSTQIGEQVKLQDITVNIEISAASRDKVQIIEDTSNKNNYQIVVNPVEFNITCTSGNKTVEVSRFKGFAERTVAIPDGVDPGKITTGVVLNADGTFSHVPTVITCIDGKYYAKIKSLTNSTYAVIYNLKTFGDVESHWAREAVNDMGSRLVIYGTGEDTFEPDRDITRAEFVAIIARALGLMSPETGQDIFNDVTKADWYYDAVSIAYENDIVSGYGSRKFRPADKVTREQAMIMIARAMNITGFQSDSADVEAGKLLESFIDASATADYAKSKVAEVIKAGIVAGRTGDVLAPQENVTKAETAVMVRKLLQTSGLI